MTTKDLAIGLDLGGTKIIIALIQNNGCILDKMEFETAISPTNKFVFERLLSFVRLFMDKHQLVKYRMKGFGIATAGLINTRNKTIIYANNLGIYNLPIGELIEQEFNLPVYLMNDANAAVVAERLWGAGEGKNNVIYITVSTGIGAGIISNGHLIEGAFDSAGEFGHISVDLNGPQCVCGNKGCLEIFASGTGISKLAIERLSNGERSLYFKSGKNSQVITAKMIGEAAKDGDVFSIDILKTVGKYLSVGITNLIHLLNPEVIVLGGGVMNIYEILVPYIKDGIQERGISHMVNNVMLKETALGKDAGVLGVAGLLFMQESTEFLYIG